MVVYTPRRLGLTACCCAGSTLWNMRLLLLWSLLGISHCFVLTMSSTMAQKPRYGGLQHAGVLVTNTGTSLGFYVHVLGFENDTHLRPNLPFPGAFVRGGTQQIHLMELPNPDPTQGRPEHGGRDRHLAFTVDDIEPIIQRLTDAQIAFTMSKSGRRAVFTRDPDGNALEFMEDKFLTTCDSA